MATCMLFRCVVMERDGTFGISSAIAGPLGRLSRSGICRTITKYLPADAQGRHQGVARPFQDGLERIVRALSDVPR